jgi:hypothetical protein
VPASLAIAYNHLHELAMQYVFDQQGIALATASL